MVTADYPSVPDLGPAQCVRHWGFGDLLSPLPIPRWIVSPRRIVLTLTALLMAGNYYCYDNPAALLSMLQSHFSHNGTPEGEQFQLYYEMMYSVYSLPNIVLPLIGGVLVDRVGVIFALNM